MTCDCEPEYTVIPQPTPTQEEFLAMMRDTFQWIMDTAIKDGEVIHFDQSTSGKNNRDLTVTVTLRHKSALD